jgi:acyl dehydratase
LHAIELKPGSKATFEKVFTQEDFDRFAALSGDNNPIHVDPHFCSQTRFGRTVAHGMLLYGVMSGVVQRCFDGIALTVQQELIFRVPTFTGEVVRFEVEIESVDEAGAEKVGKAVDQAALGKWVSIKQKIFRPDGEPGLEGSARIRLMPSLSGIGDGDFYMSRSDHLEKEPIVRKGIPVIHKGLRLGESASLARIFSPAETEEYSSVTGDRGPVFPGLDETILPGGLIGGLFSNLLGTVLPGTGTNWLKQKLRFLKPAFLGDELVAYVRVTRLRPEKDLVNLVTLCRAGSQLICEGEALVLIKDLAEDRSTGDRHA